MGDSKGRSRSVDAVGWSFIAVGLWSATTIVVVWYRSHQTWTDFSVVALPAGIGILRRNNMARSFATAIAFASAVLTMLLCWVEWKPEATVTLKILGFDVSGIPGWAGWAMATGVAVLSTWQLVTLLTPKAAREFGRPYDA